MRTAKQYLTGNIARGFGLFTEVRAITQENDDELILNLITDEGVGHYLPMYLTADEAEQIGIELIRGAAKARTFEEKA